MEGATKILQIFHNPDLYMSALGRSLLEWFWNLEDACALNLYRPLILPTPWRDRALQIRRESMKTEYPLLHRFSPDIHLARLLDHMWHDTWAIIPTLNEATLTVISLPRLHPKQRSDSVDALKKNITFIWESLTTIKESPVWSTLFGTTEVGLDSYSKLHSGCCPRPPFSSLLKYSYPSAAILDLMITSIRQFV